MLKIKLFGVGEISYLDRKITGLCHQLPGQLLCYLLLNRGQIHNREHLAAIFWGELPLLDSKKALRSNLWRLRQSLQSAGVPVAEYIFLSEKSVSFIPSSLYSMDVENFENVVLPCKDVQGIDLTSAQATALESAVLQYRGDLLENIYEDWCLYDRERLRMLHSEVLYKLMIYYSCSHMYEQAIAYGKRLLALDNTLEKIHRRLMLLYWICGERKAALTQYHICRQILHEELKCDPMEETRGMYMQMLQDKINPEEWNEMLNSPAPRKVVQPVGDDPVSRRIQSELHRLQEMIVDVQATSRSIERLIIEALNK